MTSGISDHDLSDLRLQHELAQAPIVVLVDPREARRRALERCLRSRNLEVVSVSSSIDALRAIKSHRASLLVVDDTLEELIDGSAFSELGDVAELPTVLILGLGAVADVPLDDNIYYLPTAGVQPEGIARRIGLLCLGSRLDLAPDSRVEFLVGELSQWPLLELLRTLNALSLTGELRIEGGRIVLEDGKVIEAHAGMAEGEKAFCRLARIHSGPIRLRTGLFRTSLEETQIISDLDSLLIAAIEDGSKARHLPLRTRLRLAITPGNVGSFGLDDRQKRIVTKLSSVSSGLSMSRVLDSFESRDGDLLASIAELEMRSIVRLEAARPRVRVVTDSGSDLPAHLAEPLGIVVAPIQVTFDDQTYLDGVDLDTGEFYRRLSDTPSLPVTSAVRRSGLETTYREMLGSSDVVSVHLGEELSDTVMNARSAASAIRLEAAADLVGSKGDRAIHVVDSQSASMALGMMALFAGRMAQRGLTANAIAQRIELMKSRLNVLFTVESLDAMARGGRIGKAKALLGKILGVRPILRLRDGEVRPEASIHGGAAARRRMIEILSEGADSDRPVIAAVVHARANLWAQRLRERLEETFNVRELILAEMGPTVGTHTGAGTVGVVLFQPTDSELPLIDPISEPD